MSPGANLSYAAAAAANAERMLLAAVLHAESAGLEQEDIDEFFDQFIFPDAVGKLLVALGILADSLQHEADEFGNAEVQRRRAAA